MKILYVTARLPYPPLYGDQVRALNHLRILGRRHEVTLLSFVAGRASDEALARLSPFCRQIVTVPRHRSQKVIGCLRGALSRYPFQTLFHQSGSMARAVRQQMAAGGFDLVHVQLVRMAPYFEAAAHVPRVLDLIDALSMNMERRSRRERGLLKAAALIERKRLVAYEREVCRDYDQAAVVSSLDRAAIGDFPNLHTIPMGVDLDEFRFQRSGRQPNSIVFSGNMGYFPNVDAAKWFAGEVLPLVKSQIPDVHLTIVGAHPHPAVQRLAESDPAVTVTGFVKDMHAYLDRAAIAVVPLRAGSGMQIKVIESMATGTPLVATSFGLGGIDVVGGRHLLIADEPEAFASHVVGLLRNGDLQNTLATGARRLVEEKYTWERSAAMFDEMYGLALAAHAPATHLARKAA